jgi:digeranylgeranylglycerophospholipid reductase
MYDVIIVGAGPAGSTCAQILAESGFSVKVFDRREEIGAPKRCGEGLDKGAEELIGKLPERCIANKVIGARVYAPNGKYIEIPGDGYILERKVFDKHLAYLASKCGAEIQSGSIVDDIKIEGGEVKVIGRFLDERFEERSKAVVIATGAESKIARKFLNTTCKLNLVDTCLQYEMANVKGDDRFIHIYFGNEVAPRGYCWVFPKGNGIANVGVGVIPHEKNPKFYLDNFIKNEKESFEKASIIEVNAGVVPVGGIMEDCVRDNLIVCGEAAHHVNPIHGGGIKEAIISGKIAGEVLSKCLKRKRCKKKDLEEFNKIWTNERGKKLKKVEKAREAMEKLKDEDFNYLVEILDPESIINIAEGNLMAVAKLLLKHPKLVKYAKLLV